MASDCGLLGVWPYAEVGDMDPFSPKWRFFNPKSFQIISPGADGRFGQGSVPDADGHPWTPSTATNSAALWGWGPPGTAPYRAGADDISNFYDRPLGVSE